MGDEVVIDIKRDSIGKKSRSALFKLVSLPGIVHRSLVLFIAVVLMSESVAAAPRRMGVSIAQQPAATEQDATRAAAEHLYQEGEQLINQGTAESLRQAITKFEEVLPLYRAVGDRRKEGLILNEIGYIYSALGEKQKALEFYNQSLPLSRVIGDKAGEAVSLNNIGRVYDALGQKQKALEYYNQSLTLSRAAGDKKGEARTLNNIGLVHSALGQKQKALDYYNQSLPLRRATGDKKGEAITLNNIGRVYDALGQKQKALEYYNQSLPLSRAAEDKAQEAVTLNNIGAVYDTLDQKQKALEYYNQSLPLRRVTGDKTGEAATLNNIGRIYDTSGQKQKALEYYNQSLPLSRATGDKATEAITLYNLAYLERKRGNLNVALNHMEASITIIEDLRTKIDSQQLRTSYFATVQDYYQFYIDLLMQLHKSNPSKRYDALALNASERARARSLLELLTEARANIRSGADPKLLELERTLQQQLDATEQRRIQLLSTQYTNKQLAQIKQQQDSLNAQIEQVQQQIRKTSPRYASLKYPQPLTLQQIQSTVLDDNTLLLEYSLGEKRSYLWAVTKTSITSYELPKRADIEKAAQQFYEQTGKQKAPSSRGLGATPREDSFEVTAQLSQMLLSPVAAQLGQKRLLIVSDGVLQYLPFAALPTPDSLGKDKTPVPLIVQHEIVNSPSASTVAVIRQDTNGRKVAPKKVAVIADPVFDAKDERVRLRAGAQPLAPLQSTKRSPLQLANPDDLDSLALTRSAQEVGFSFQRLPFTRKEGSRILSLIPTAQTQSAFDFAANRATATSPELSQYQIVHFATHGILNSKHPELSGVVFSLVDEKGTPQNGFLRLNDIFNLNLPAELIVLSACETGLGQEVKGEGLVGLTRGFMYAGAPRVVVSLWSVDDAGTSELMTRFYKKMLQEGLKPVAALRAAQLEMLNSEWKAPYYWAGFVVQGEWN
jgi:CHAT domain-containing protein/Flp pilus assembly protein TadD